MTATKFRKTADGSYGVVRGDQFVALAEQTSEEFEAFLRKNRISGMMAVAYSQKRKRDQKFLASLGAAQ